MFPPKKESAPFNYRKEHCSSIISGTFGSRNPNLPRCLCIFSSALASSVFPAAVIKLPHWNIWRALPVYVLCADSMPCKITIWRIIHRKEICSSAFISSLNQAAGQQQTQHRLPALLLHGLTCVQHMSRLAGALGRRRPCCGWRARDSQSCWETTCLTASCPA